jgi:hypothetical protein
MERELLTFPQRISSSLVLVGFVLFMFFYVMF